MHICCRCFVFLKNQKLRHKCHVQNSVAVHTGSRLESSTSFKCCPQRRTSDKPFELFRRRTMSTEQQTRPLSVQRQSPRSGVFLRKFIASQLWNHLSVTKCHVHTGPPLDQTLSHLHPAGPHTDVIWLIVCPSFPKIFPSSRYWGFLSKFCFSRLYYDCYISSLSRNGFSQSSNVWWMLRILTFSILSFFYQEAVDYPASAHNNQ